MRTDYPPQLSTASDHVGHGGTHIQYAHAPPPPVCLTASWQPVLCLMSTQSLLLCCWGVPPPPTTHTHTQVNIFYYVTTVLYNVRAGRHFTRPCHHDILIIYIYMLIMNATYVCKTHGMHVPMLANTHLTASWQPVLCPINTQPLLLCWSVKCCASRCNSAASLSREARPQPYEDRHKHQTTRQRRLACVPMWQFCGLWLVPELMNRNARSMLECSSIRCCVQLSSILVKGGPAPALPVAVTHRNRGTGWGGDADHIGGGAASLLGAWRHAGLYVIISGPTQWALSTMYMHSTQRQVTNRTCSTSW